MRSKKLPLLSLLLVAAGCTAAKSSSDTTAADTGKAVTTASDDNASKDAIAKLRAAWKDAADRKDSAAVAALYTDDANIVTSQAPLAEGKDAVLKSLGRLVNLTKIKSIDSKETVVHGDDAYDYGTFTEDVTDPKGKTQSVSGYFVVTMHRQADGSWKITHHVAAVPLS